MAYNPNAIFVSPSSLSDLEKCPQLYFLRSIFRNNRGNKIQLVSPALALGQAVHDTIDQFLALEPGERNEAELKRITNLLWGNNAAGEKGGFTDKTQEAEFRDRAEAMLAHFWKNDHFKNAVKAKLPNFPKVDLDRDVILTGKLDWVEAGDDGYYTIIDFKTGKNKEREDSLQLPIYALLGGNIFKTHKLKAKYWYLDSTEEMEEVALPTLAAALEIVKKKAETAKLVVQTKSFQCRTGKESCWACRDMQAISRGEGKLVRVDMSRKQEIYILPKADKTPEAEKWADDIPF